MKACQFIQKFSLLENKLETLNKLDLKLKILLEWLIKAHKLKGAALYSYSNNKQKVFFSGKLELNGKAVKLLAEIAHKIQENKIEIIQLKKLGSPAQELFNRTKKLIYISLKSNSAKRDFNSLFIFTSKASAYLKAKQSELLLFSSKIKDLLVIESLKHQAVNKLSVSSKNLQNFAEIAKTEVLAVESQFINQLNYPMFIMDSQAQVLSVNEAFLKRLGFSDLNDFLAEGNVFAETGLHNEILATMQKTNAAWKLKVILLTKDKNQVPMSLSLTQNKGLIIGSLFDVSEYIKIADELRDSLKTQEFLNDKLINAALLLHKTQSSAIRSLARLAEYRDHETGDHLQRIREYSRLLALEIYKKQPYNFKIRAEYCEDIFLSSMLHDIGKVGIPDQILLKQGKLTDEEWKIMKNHTVIGWTILNQADCELGEQSFLTLASQIALNHHERWDGSGYPNGLGGEKIPLSARISAIADVYDALTSQRPYKKPWHHKDAITEIRNQAEKAFDPILVDILLSVEKKMIDIHCRFPK